MKSKTTLLGLTFGIAIGTIIGVSTNNIPFWMLIGIALGLILGAGVGANAKIKNESCKARNQMDD